MILDHLARAAAYRNIHPRLTAGLAWLSAQDWSRVADGRHAIDGEMIYVTVETGMTRPIPGRRFESHRRYADIQFDISGGERMGWLPGADLAVSEQTGPDMWFHVQPTATVNYVLVPAEHFTVFLPGEAHMPLCPIDSVPNAYRKCVVKVDWS